MVSFRFSANLAIIASASLLTGYEAGAQHAVPSQNLRKLDTNEYEYVGCFKDSQESRILPDYFLIEDDMTTESCFEACDGIGASLMGTQYGIECWCAQDAAEEVDYSRHGEGAQCDKRCGGDQDETCGGNYAVDLYLINRGF